MAVLAPGAHRYSAHSLVARSLYTLRCHGMHAQSGSSDTVLSTTTLEFVDNDIVVDVSNAQRFWACTHAAVAMGNALPFWAVPTPCVWPRPKGSANHAPRSACAQSNAGLISASFSALTTANSITIRVRAGSYTFLVRW